MSYSKSEMANACDKNSWSTIEPRNPENIDTSKKAVGQIMFKIMPIFVSRTVR